MTFTIGIVGSSHAPAELFVPTVRRIVTPFIGVTGFSIASGGASGADSAAKMVAVELGIPIKEYLPDKEKYPTGNDAYRARNQLIADNSNEIWSLVCPLTETKCYHCTKARKDDNHERTGGCWTGRMKGEWRTVVVQ